MNRLLCASAFALARLASGAEAASTGAAAKNPVDDLSQAAIQTAFQVLSGDYIRRDDLTYDELNRAALQGLLERLPMGAELIRRNGDEKPADAGLHFEMLPGDTAYARPLGFDEKTPAQLAARLKEAAANRARYLVLDLRQPSAPGSFDVAAAVLECFVPQGELLFKMKQLGRESADLFFSRSDPAWRQPLVVLVDEDTSNVGETIAAVLEKRGLALLLGSPTRGGAVRYETRPVDARWMLRFARAEMLLADDTSIFQKGLVPRFRVPAPVEVKRSIFLASSGKTMTPHLRDTQKRRYSEADLVAGRNPDLDSYIERSTGKAVVTAPVPQDVVLQRALDMLQSSSHLFEAKLRWDASGPASPSRRSIPKAKPASP
jgi:hypothetical protein